MSDNTTAAAADSSSSAIQRLVLVFDYRSLFDADDVDAINHQAWQEVLDGFGYQGLTFEHFMSTSMVHKSPSEIMRALCPFTTRAEWTPLLNKRTVRLLRDMGDMCYTQVLPIGGLTNFFVDCAHEALVTTVLLSPFPDEVTRKMLERAELSPFIDLLHCYEDRDYALLEALELIDAKPPIIPADIQEHRWRHQMEEIDEVLENPVVGDKTGDNDAEDTPTNHHQHRPSLTAADVKNMLEHPNIVVFTTDVVGCQQATDLGCTAIGVVHNSGFYPSTIPQSPPSPTSNSKATEDTATSSSSAAAQRQPIVVPSLPATSLGESLLSSGASAVLDDYTNLKSSYLAHFMK